MWRETLSCMPLSVRKGFIFSIKMISFCFGVIRHYEEGNLFERLCCIFKKRFHLRFVSSLGCYRRCDMCKFISWLLCTIYNTTKLIIYFQNSYVPLFTVTSLWSHTQCAVLVFPQLTQYWWIHNCKSPLPPCCSDYSYLEADQILRILLFEETIFQMWKNSSYNQNDHVHHTILVIYEHSAYKSLFREKVRLHSPVPGIFPLGQTFAKWQHRIMFLIAPVCRRSRKVTLNVNYIIHIWPTSVLLFSDDFALVLNLNAHFNFSQTFFQ